MTILKQFLLTTFLLLLSPSSASQDINALLSFQSSSDPLNHSLVSWSESSNPCNGSWLGVTCQADRVVHLVLENLGLVGHIDALTKLDQLRLLSLKNNNLSSNLATLNLSSWKDLKLLYLSNNHLHGQLLNEIGCLRRLHRLDLSGNRLSGVIPVALGRLTRLMTLRLERNSFSGTLQPLSGLSSISDFNVSENVLSGEIPESLSTFPPSAFWGNRGLSRKPNQTTIKRSDNSRRVIHAWSIVATCTVGATLLIFLLWYRCHRHHGERRRIRNNMRDEEMETNKINGRVMKEGLVFYEGCDGFTMEELMRASAEMVGRGPLGTTYKVEMGGGGGQRALAVKRVRVGRGRSLAEEAKMQEGLKEIGQLRHPNVAGLRAHCSSYKEVLLIYDYFNNGSLHSLLHGDRCPGRIPLDWTTRLKLASGAAKGLSFLHASNKSKMIPSHQHVTSSNILIDADGNACISDFALHHLFLSSSPSNSLDTENCDIYSFGVVLLEMLTGRTVGGEGESNLVKWVTKIVGEEEYWTSKVLDLEILRYKEMESEMIALLQVALLCLATTPQDRPKMSIVYKMIEDIRERGSRGRVSASPSVISVVSEDIPNFTSS